jgi:hypothetical protein
MMDSKEKGMLDGTTKIRILCTNQSENFYFWVISIIVIY